MKVLKKHNIAELKRNVIYASLALLLCSLIGCSNNSKFPPSPYIGIFDQYNGYENGNLPGNDSHYSGYWHYAFNGKVIAEGFYKDGKPIGFWRSFYTDGNLNFLAIYTDAGEEQKISYYPDGMLQTIENHSHNSNSAAPITSCIRFYPDGTPLEIPRTSNQSQWHWGDLSSLSPIYLNKSIAPLKIDVYGYFFIKSDNAFDMWYYVCPFEDSVWSNQIKKIKVSGVLDPLTGELKQISTHNIIGATKVSLSTQNDSAVLKSLFVFHEKFGDIQFEIEFSSLAFDKNKELQNEITIKKAISLLPPTMKCEN